MFTVSLDDCHLKILIELHLQNAILLYLQMISLLSSLHFFKYWWIQPDAFFCKKTIALDSLIYFI